MRAIRIAAPVLHEVTRGLSLDEKAEMGIPSYTHPNPLVRWLYWARLDAALSLARPTAGERVLDFASGPGVLIPTLAAIGCEIAASDLHPAPFLAQARRRGVDVEAVDLADLANWANARAGSLDLVFALDVLEHVDDAELAELVVRFARVLRSGGTLVVSGGTETFMYRLARRLAGFTGDYHHRSIFDAHRALAGTFREIGRHSLPPRPLPHGYIVTAHRPKP